MCSLYGRAVKNGWTDRNAVWGRADSCWSRCSCIRWDLDPHGNEHLAEHVPAHCNVPTHDCMTAQNTQWTNAVAAARGDKTRRRCDLLSNYFLWTLVKLLGFKIVPRTTWLSWRRAVGCTGSVSLSWICCWSLSRSQETTAWTRTLPSTRTPTSRSTWTSKDSSLPSRPMTSNGSSSNCQHFTVTRIGVVWLTFGFCYRTQATRTIIRTRWKILWESTTPRESEIWVFFANTWQQVL